MPGSPGPVETRYMYPNKFSHFFLNDKLMVKYWPADKTDIGPIVDQCVFNMILGNLLQ